jgi:hypothetical protein
MKRPTRFRQSRILRRDWIGDALITLTAGGVLLASVFLPWANEDGRGWVNYSLTQGDGLNGVLQTQWGTPALVLSLVVLAAGLVMLVTRPRRFSALLGVLVAASGVAAFWVTRDAAVYTSGYDPGIGMYLTTLVAVLLVPIGLAAALVAVILVRAERAATPAVTAAGAPPAPPSLENGPPS